MIIIIPIIIYYLPLITDKFTVCFKGEETKNIQIKEIGNIKGDISNVKPNENIVSFYSNNKWQLFFIDNNPSIFDFETGIFRNVSALKNKDILSVISDKSNNLVIVNKENDNNKVYLTFSKFNVSSMEFEKQHLIFEIDKNAIVDVCNLDDSKYLYFRIIVPNKSDNFILAVKEDDFSIIKMPYNSSISGGDTISVIPYGTFLIGGYDNQTNRKSNDIYRTDDNFKTLKKIASIDKKIEIIKSCWIVYFGEYSDGTSIPEQDIFIFGKDTTNGKQVCYKFNTRLKKVKVEEVKLNKNIQNSEIVEIFQVVDYKTAVFRGENKYYFSSIKYKSALKNIDYLFEDDCEKIIFTKRPPYYSDNKILIIGSKNQTNLCNVIKEISF